MHGWESSLGQFFIKTHNQINLTDAQSEPINVGQGRKGSPSAGRTGARLISWLARRQAAPSAAARQTKPCRWPPTFPTGDAGSSLYSEEQCSLSPVPARRSRAAKDQFTALGSRCLPQQHSKELLCPG